MATKDNPNPVRPSGMPSEPIGWHCWNRRPTSEPSGEFLTQEAFSKKICEERKRTDRSENPFILMLIDVHRLNASEPAQAAKREIIEILLSSKRETDTCGWHATGSTIGILFTEIGDTGTGHARQTIAKKIGYRLSESIAQEFMDQVGAFFHCYPERHGDTEKVDLFEKTLYPDLQRDDAAAREGLLAKRLIDVAGSAIALILCAPLLGVISLLILATSRGPVLFRQERLGQFGSRFTFLKFRSMYVNADDSVHREYIRKLITENRPSEDQCEEAPAPVYKLRNDPRITPVGRFLRKTSLDELPQLLNVLKGEMSLVGPRPPIPYEFENYDIWHRYRLLQVKPGITGLWQVTGRSSTSFDEMVRLDLKYVQEWSLWLDFKILLLTPWVVIKGKGAY